MIRNTRDCGSPCSSSTYLRTTFIAEISRRRGHGPQDTTFTLSSETKYAQQASLEPFKKGGAVRSGTKIVEQVVWGSQGGCSS